MKQYHDGIDDFVPDEVQKQAERVVKQSGQLSEWLAEAEDLVKRVQSEVAGNSQAFAAEGYLEAALSGINGAKNELLHSPGRGSS